VDEVVRQERVRAGIHRKIAAAEFESIGNHADAGQQRNQQHEKQLVLPGAVHPGGDAGDVVLAGQPAAQAHHGFARLGTTRALLTAFTAVVTEPRTQRGTQTR